VDYLYAVPQAMQGFEGPSVIVLDTNNHLWICGIPGGGFRSIPQSHSLLPNSKSDKQSETERFGGLEIEDQLDLDGLLDLQISRFVTFEARIAGCCCTSLPDAATARWGLFGRH
jgi:hypothetical protein